MAAVGRTRHHTASQQDMTSAPMEAAISTIVSQFKKHAGKDDRLSEDELQKLVSSELPNYVKITSDPGAIKDLMGSQDQNNDGELTFLEFWQLIGNLASKQGDFSG